MISILLFSLAHADDPHALARIFDLQNSGRAVEARQEATKLVLADPTDLGAQLTYLHQHTDGTKRAAKAQIASYTTWLSERPDDPARHVELALAMAIAASDGRGRDGLPPSAGPWCEPVLAELSTLPQEPENRARALKLRINVSDRCGRDPSADWAEMATLAQRSTTAKVHALWYQLQDNIVEEADAIALGEVLTLQPWRLADFRGIWSEKATGPGLESARARSRETAAKNTLSDDPLLVSAALSVYVSAHEVEAGLAAGERLKKLDPTRPWIPEPRPSSPKRNPPPPASLGDAAAALAALDARKDKVGKYEKLTWTLARADALLALGRDAEALNELHRAYVLDPGIGSNLRFAREALRQRAQLRAAKHAVDVAVYTLEETFGGWGGADWEQSLPERREALADALALRSSVFHALGKDRKAAQDASQSLVLHDQPGTSVLLGLAFAALDWRAGAFDSLSRGLAGGGSGDKALDDEAHAALARLWPEQGIWNPGGLDGWLDALKSVPTAAPDGGPPGERAGETFPDLRITLDGVEKQLSELAGPLVVDLWATWCGPCRQALPHLDQVARDFPGVTVLAISVDDEAAQAEAYLSKSTPRFRAAWAGPEAMKTAGVNGIPTTFILDAEHRIVDVLHGWGPGDTSLQTTLARTLTSSDR